MLIRNFFYKNGYLIIKNAINQELVDEALRDINHFMGTPNFRALEDEMKLKFSFPPEMLIGQSMINLLYLSVAFNAAKSLFGPNNFLKTVRAAQIALRFPEKNKPSNPLQSWHIDGMDKVYGGENHPFALLLGIALSDQTKPNCGNLRVFPGTHILMQEPYKKAIEARSPLDMRLLNVGEPEQVLLSPGDIVLCHQMLAHGIGINQSPNIRYQIYFRLSHKDHAQLKPMMIDNMWIEYEGLKNVINN